MADSCLSFFGFGVQGLRAVQGSGFRVLEFGVWGWVKGSGFGVKGFRAEALRPIGCRV